MIERQLFIKDLFNSKDILNAFKEIEFENFKTFTECLKKDTITLTKQVIINLPVKTFEEIDVFVKLAAENYMCEMTNFNLLIKPDLLETFFDRSKPIKNKRFSITTTDDIEINRFDLHIIESFLSWTRSNPLWIETNINYDNFEESVIKIIEIYMKLGYRFFKINFDYESFDKMTIEELHKLEFWLRQLNIWKISSMDKKNKKNKQPMMYYRRKGKTIFVSRDFKLYVTKQAFEEGDMLFDLAKHYKHNGNEVPFKELNILRSYIDMKKDFDGLTDFYQNKKIMGNFVEEAYITKFIGGILK